MVDEQNTEWLIESICAASLQLWGTNKLSFSSSRSSSVPCSFSKQWTSNMHLFVLSKIILFILDCNVKPAGLHYHGSLIAS